MATYNKPGVYVEDTLLPSAQAAADTTQTVAAIIGVTDRGPTTTVNGNLIGMPTLVTSWNDFVNKFSFGSNNDIWDQTASTTTAAMRYAMRTFFDNGGLQAYVIRVVNTDAKAGAISVIGQSRAATTVTGTVSASTTASTIVVTLTGTGISNVSAGDMFTLSGFSTTSTTENPLNKSWVVGTVTSATSFTLKGTVTTPVIATTANGVVTANGIATTGTPGIIISAADEGDWSKNLFVDIEPNANPNYFNLFVYYQRGVTDPISLTTQPVDQIYTLSIDPADANYAPTKVNSSWIKVTATNATSTVGVKVISPTFYRADGTGGTSGAYIQGPVNIGNNTAVLASTIATVTTATNGSTGSTTMSNITASLDNITNLSVINYPINLTAITESATSTNVALINYAASRGDMFVVVDAIASSVAKAIDHATTISNNVSAPSNASYGAVYYPQITIPDPATKLNTTINVPSGAAVVASYLLTDAQRGTYKAPAGVTTVLRPAVNLSYQLTESDYTYNSTSPVQLNAIRYVSGSGFCVMGARTLSKSVSEVYIPVRRTISYIRRGLTDRMTTYLFEPNNFTTWEQLTAEAESFLYSLWQKNGLYGNTPSQAYYVLCDETTNTQTAIDNGELRMEVGVALLRPAEFIVVKLGQFQGGTTATLSV